MEEYTRMPLRSYETRAMQFLLGLSQECSEACKTLERRLATVGKSEALARAGDEVRNTVTELMKTVPANKLMTMKQNLQNLEMTIRVKRVAGIDTGDEACYVNTSLLKDVLREYASDKCRLCLGGVDEQRKCRYKQLMDDILMEDLPDKPYSCKYRDAEWTDE